MITIYDPLTTRADPNRPGAYLRAAFPSNRIPADRINPMSATISTYYPGPTSAGDPGTGLNNFFFSGPQIRTTNDFSGRGDHQWNSSTLLMGRFSRFNVSPRTNPATFRESNIASPGYVTKPRHHINGLGKLTKKFSSSFFGEFVAFWVRWYYRSFGLSNGFAPTQLGLPAYLAKSSATLGFPAISIREMSGVGTHYNEHDVSDRVELRANLSKVAGKHTLKF